MTGSAQQSFILIPWFSAPASRGLPKRSSTHDRLQSRQSEKRRLIALIVDSYGIDQRRSAILHVSYDRGADGQGLLAVGKFYRCSQ